MKVFARVSGLVLASVAVVGMVGMVACQKQSESRHSDSQGKMPEDGAGALGDKPRLDPSKVVLTWDNGPMTYGELRKKKEAAFKKLYNKYINDVYQAEQQELENYVVQSLVEKKAKEAGKTSEEFVQSLGGEVTVTDQDMHDFYDKNVKQSGQAFDAVKERLKPYLESQKKQEKVRAEFDKMKAEAHVKIDLPPPEVASVKFDLSDHPVRGNPNGKVTVVEFSDFQCPYCSRATPAIDAFLKAYPNDIKFYFLHYPLSFHKNAMPAAIAAVCAAQQDKFWPFHDKLFQSQASLGDDFYKATAKEVGLDEAKFASCVSSPATKDKVQKDMDQANAAGVEGTPSFFINGAQYAQGVPTVEALKSYVDRAASN